MRDIDLRRLRYFTVLAETLHFGRAAELLHISQPGLSAEIRRLESQLEVKLFSRTPRTALTHAGEVLLSEAEAVLAGADRFASASAVLASGQAGVVTIGSTASVLEHGLLDAVARLTEEAPDLRVLVEELSSAESVTALRSGGVDFACGNSSADGPDVTSTRLTVAPFALVVPMHASAALRPIGADRTAGADGSQESAVTTKAKDARSPGTPRSLAECGGLPFSVFRRSASPRFHDTVRALCDEAGFAPRFTYRSRTWRSALDAVAAGLCVSLAPLPIAQARVDEDPRLRIAHVVDSTLAAESWISRRADSASLLFDRVEQAVVEAFR